MSDQRIEKIFSEASSLQRFVKICPMDLLKDLLWKSRDLASWQGDIIEAEVLKYWGK